MNFNTFSVVPFEINDNVKMCHFIYLAPLFFLQHNMQTLLSKLTKSFSAILFNSVFCESFKTEIIFETSVRCLCWLRTSSAFVAASCFLSSPTTFRLFSSSLTTLECSRRRASSSAVSRAGENVIKLFCP
jgi:hypothetical protein